MEKAFTRRYMSQEPQKSPDKEKVINDRIYAL